MDKEETKVVPLKDLVDAAGVEVGDAKEFWQNIYPYDRIIDKANGSWVAVIYKNKLVAIGNTAFGRPQYNSVLGCSHASLRKKVAKLQFLGKDANDLWWEIKDLKMADKKNIPNPIKEIKYENPNARYKIVKNVWSFRQKKYLVIYQEEILPEKWKGLFQTEDAAEAAKFLAKELGRDKVEFALPPK